MTNKHMPPDWGQELADNLNRNVREEVKGDLINSAVAVSDSLRILLRQGQIPGVIHQKAIQNFIDMVDRYKDMIKSK
jgi:hypothetical protein